MGLILRLGLLLPLCSGLAGGQVKLEMKGGQALFTSRGQEVLRLELKPRVFAPNKKTQYVLDTAFLAASCLVVCRNYHVPPGPDAAMDTVELYTVKGQKSTINSPALLGFFSGQCLTSPRGDWAALLRLKEGAFTGYLHLTSQGAFKRYDFEFPLQRVKPGSEFFSTKDELILPNLKEKGRPLSLVIGLDGNALFIQ